eukprot:gene7100-14445_t
MEIPSSKKIVQFFDNIKPSNVPNWSWCYVFIPALLGYLLILMQHINEKPVIGKILSFDPKFQEVFRTDSKIEIISKDSIWSEGPLWIDDQDTPASYLLFSDVGKNRIYKWEDGKGPFTIGKSVYADKSGCKSNSTFCSQLAYPGTTGIIRFSDGKAIDLLAGQDGERAITIFYENGTRFHLATHFEGKRFNSPNDLVWSRDGNLYFTDLDYGLLTSEYQMLEREIPHTGVYMIPRDSIVKALETHQPVSDVKLLTKEMSRPNGLAFSPDHKLLYVSNSHQEDSFLNVYSVLEDGSLDHGKLFYNGTSLRSPSTPLGACDGLKVDNKGNLIASAPGGVVVLSPDGRLLGRLLVDYFVSNVAFSHDGYIFLTANSTVLRVKTVAKPARIYLYSPK